MSTSRRWMVGLGLLVGAFALIAFTPLGPAPDDIDDGRGTPWIVERADNVCGIDEPRRINRPAVVDWARALAVTPPIREMVRKGIDPESPEGIVLRAAGAEIARDACAAVRADEGYCSVWRRILRRDGGKVPDVTALVVARIRALVS